MELRDQTEGGEHFLQALSRREAQVHSEERAIHMAFVDGDDGIAVRLGFHGMTYVTTPGEASYVRMEAVWSRE